MEGERGRGEAGKREGRHIEMGIEIKGRERIRRERQRETENGLVH